MSNHSIIGGAGCSALRACLVALCLGLACATSHAAEPARPFNARFIAIAFHDVVDSKAELDDDAVTTDRLVAFFDWLRGNDWTAISIDDVLRAQRGEKPLPPRAVLISFDDGYRSLYTRVYPLALAYRMPIVAALVGDWTEAPAGTSVRYGNRELPREHFITWAEAREMQRSGLVEFALHTQSMHQGVLGNPQGNTMPAANTLRYDPATGYESEAAFTARLRADLARGRVLLQRELGRAPRVLVWPYGRYNAIGLKEARALGFEVALSLDVSMANAQAAVRLRDAELPLSLARYLPTFNPRLDELIGNLQPDPNEPDGLGRLTCLDPAALWAEEPAAQDERLGRAIERARALGLTGIVVEAVQRDAQGHVVAAWFPNRELPLAGDLLSRIAWQMQSRAGVEVYVRLPHRAAAAALGADAARVRRLYEDLGAMVPLSGWLLEDEQLAEDGALEFKDPPPLFGDATRTRRGWAAWVVRDRRVIRLARLGATGAPDALAWDAYSALAFARPNVRLLWLAKTPSDGSPVAPHPLAEFTLVPASLDRTEDEAQVDPRLTRWYTGVAPPDPAHLADAAIDYQRKGGVTLGWCPDDPIGDRPEAAIVAPGVSASTFPVLP